MALEDPTQLPLLKKLMKRGKYGNKKVAYRGAMFDSQRELKRYLHLQMLEDVGAIRDLKRQVVFRLKVKGCKVTKYVADFVYIQDGKKIVEDCKGHRTREYLLKKKLMLAVHGIEILES